MAMLQKQRKAAWYIRELHQTHLTLRTAIVATTTTFSSGDWRTETTIFILNRLYLLLPNNGRSCLTKQSKRQKVGWMTSVYHVRIQQPDCLPTSPFQFCNLKTQTRNLESLHTYTNCKVVVDVDASRTPTKIRITPFTETGPRADVGLLLHPMKVSLSIEVDKHTSASQR